MLRLVGSFYSENIGVYPTGGSVEFMENRVIIIETEADFESDFEITIKEIRNTGTYSVQGNTITLNIISPYQKTIFGEIKLYKDKFGFITNISLIIDGTEYSTIPDLIHNSKVK